MEQYIEFAGNNPVLSMAWLAIVTMLLVITIKSKLSNIKEVNNQQLTLSVNRENGVIVDIRSDADFKKGHIIGSKQVSMEKITNNELASLEKEKGNPIIVVCAAGMTASKAASNLAKAGFEQVSILKGGFAAWQGANLPVAK
ncbi:rhodanese-like domain-containing protein [Thalassotalea psychrophila]|uniref:Rhodanese-like domain-containing protein n=1 Tax=Thalassotalea psychrophila TaxID=3065647 RepID=A0ABY9TXR3_9GAMM|nr:rhodanese-like domain-containing protein [Colwelliaceae bacterium SQ149]